MTSAAQTRSARRVRSCARPGRERERCPVFPCASARAWTPTRPFLAHEAGHPLLGADARPGGGARHGPWVPHRWSATAGGSQRSGGELGVAHRPSRRWTTLPGVVAGPRDVEDRTDPLDPVARWRARRRTGSGSPGGLLGEIGGRLAEDLPLDLELGDLLSQTPQLASLVLVQGSRAVSRSWLAIGSNPVAERLVADVEVSGDLGIGCPSSGRAEPSHDETPRGTSIGDPTGTPFRGLAHYQVRVRAGQHQLHPRAIPHHLGYSTSRPSMELYAHVSDDADKDSANRLEARFNDDGSQKGHERTGATSER